MGRASVRLWSALSTMLPVGLGYVEEVSHSRLQAPRHYDVVVALDVLDVNVVAECKPQHRHQEFPAFLRRIDQTVPQRLDIQLIDDTIILLSIRE